MSWRDAALCAQVGPDRFFPPSGDAGAAAKAVCRRCPALDACRAWTLADDAGRAVIEIHGVQGGMSRGERLLRRAEAGA